MKTIEFYLLLILFFNVFSQGDTSDSTISDTNLDSSNTNLEATTTDKPNTDSTSIVSDASTNTNPDSSSTISETNAPNADTSSIISETNAPNADTSSIISETNAPNADTSLIISETNSPNEDSSTMNSDILSSIDTNGNSTMPTNKPRIVLLGFGGFQRYNATLVLFKTYFKRFLMRIPSRILHFTVVTNYLRRLRVLEEQTVTVNCSLIPADSDDDMVFDCGVPVNANRDFTMSAKDDFVFEGVDTDLVVSSYANNTMKSLSSQTNDIFKNGVLVLSDSTLTKNDNNFIIEGTLMDGQLNDKQVILSFDENGDGNLVNATCNVKNDKGSRKYELVCSSNKKINAHLEGVMGETSDKPLLINMADVTSDYVDFDPSSSSSSGYRVFKKKSSDGLSKGAIAGIIIGCCVALIAALITAILCSRKTNPPIGQTSALELNSSNTIKNNIY